MAAPVVRADRDLVLPVRVGASASREAATIRVPVVVVPATIGAGGRAGLNQPVPVGVVVFPAVISVSRQRAVVV